MKMFVRSIAALGLLGLLSVTAQAQGPRGGFGMGGGLMLLQNEGVQKELKLTEEQISKAREAGQALRERFSADLQGFRDKTEAERRELTEKMSAESKKLLADVLKSEQTKRFEQIQLQARGVQAFVSEEVQKALTLTEEQQAKIKTITEDLGQQMREAFQAAQGDFQAAASKVSSIRKDAMTKATALLSEDQKKAWSELTGAPFELSFGPPRRPRSN